MADKNKEKTEKQQVAVDQAGSNAIVNEELPFWSRHRLTLLLILTIFVAGLLTSVSVTIYNISGAAQLDLSRPGYREVSDKVDTKTKIDKFSNSGPVNKDTIQEFIDLYDAQAEKAKAVDAFNGDPLNPEVLGFGEQ